MTDVVKGLLVGLACVTPLGAQERTFIGAQACRTCHPAQFASQSAGGHAQALFRGNDHPLAHRFDTAEPLVRGPFRFQFDREGPRVRVDDGRYVTELPIEWAFGAGEHAVTFVSKVSEEYYLEHSFSYYTDTRTFGLTPRHDALPAATLHQAMGQPIKRASIRACFACHSTGPVSASADGAIAVTEPGVRCEACHGAGSAHQSAAAAGDVARANRLITKPSNLSAAGLNRFCGECHRTIGEAQQLDWDSPWSVRHQPPYLARSRCFQNGNGALSCLTCHAAHERVRRDDAAYYRNKCASCHQSGSHAQSDSDCISCHMPTVDAGPHMKFKNHWIGVYAAGGTLRPLK